MSYLATDSLFPEWKVWNQFLEESNHGLTLDGLAESHPIEVRVLPEAGRHGFFLFHYHLFVFSFLSILAVIRNVHCSCFLFNLKKHIFLSG